MGAGIFGEALVSISQGGVFYPEAVRDAIKQPTSSGERLHLLNDLTERELEVLGSVATGSQGLASAERRERSAAASTWLNSCTLTASSCSHWGVAQIGERLT